MKIKTSELIGEALDLAVAICAGFEYPYKVCGRGAVRATGLLNTTTRVTYVLRPTYTYWIKRCEGAPFFNGQQVWEPSTDWAQGGPIIERERLNVYTQYPCSPLDETTLWNARKEDYKFQQSGPTPLIVAMRCYVASKLGGEIEIPEELL